MNTPLRLAEAARITATGDLWLFRGRTVADRAIQTLTNSPVNHVGVVLALEGLPPLLWHSEMGSSLPDVWAGERRRGAQLHRLEHAVSVWAHRYGQRAWVRQIEATITKEMEDSFLRTVNELGGRRFPSALKLARRWVKGRFGRFSAMEELFCAQLVAVTYERMGLLDSDLPANSYDPGRFWSGDGLQLQGATLSPELPVTDIPPPPPRPDRSAVTQPR